MASLALDDVFPHRSTHRPARRAPGAPGRRRTQRAALRMGRAAVTPATWLTFAEGGGYERREWWSDEGWAWKEEYDISRPGQRVTDRSGLRGSSTAAGRRALKLRGSSVDA